MSPPHPPLALTVSIVSHQHGPMLGQLLSDLRQARFAVPWQLVLTINVPEDESFIAPYRDLPLTVIRNPEPKGFGANHNAAFRRGQGSAFAVVNPDIRLAEVRLEPLLETLQSGHTGACAPLVLSSTSETQDSARRYPTVWRLARRVITGIRRSDYAWHDQPIDVEWVAGMFVLYRREAFEAMQGFDERFFMYFEDADICRRMARAGWAVKFDPRTSVIHDAQRDSHRNWRHLRWHLRSAATFLLCK